MQELQMEKFIDKANTLIEALPYIKKFRKKTIIIKYGGSFMYDQDIKESIMDDIALMKLVGFRPIIIHGGGKDISTMLERLHIETEFIDGLRKTTEDVMEVVEMVLTGKINKEIVQLLENRGITAIGLSGKDGGLLKATKRLSNDQDIGYVGDVASVKTELLTNMLRNDYVPIITPIGSDEKGHSYNINADHVSFAVAKALKAEKLIFLTDTNGIYKDVDDPSSNIRNMNIAKAMELIEKGIISGGMIPKVESAIEAIESEVSSVHILDGRMQHSLLLELFTAAGCGTMIHC